ncbi:P-loop containing nucleoside triphosphate hydrolase protein [Thelephora ganbajun]|uniref:P-loop containing nucleoside triphosphate hydrolase protein n=1 Tax=Thelephora ganbajun TaxID=370292 RepID=A0ACB6ZAS2_THEGA|nr:P-loop containing nucleoside triphosphate hydrolase protein [Thelephora ganbajun]
MQGSVLGKRSQSSTDSPSCPRDLPTPEVTPTAKRIKTTSTLIDLNPDGNKENIPPLPESPSPRRLRRTVTGDHTSPRNARTPRRHFSASSLDPRTPSTPLSHLTLTTPPPTPPSLLVPIYARARALLRSTSNGMSPLSGRATERALISEFITSFMGEAKDPASTQSTSLYISGSPGTGKTAVVNSVISELPIPPTFTVVTINCMALNDVDFLWSRLVDELSSAKVKTKKTAKGIDGVNRLLSAYSLKCLLVLDELDHIASSPQSIASIFSVAQAHPSRLRIISIANTHTLTSTSSPVDIQGIASVRTVHFPPYTSEQLADILMTRLGPLFNDTVHLKQAEKLLPKTSLTLLSKKIAAQAGDVRSLFEVLRGAIDSASKASTDITLDGPVPVVTPNHIISALKSYAPASTATSSDSRNTNAASSSEIIAKVARLGLQARLSLLAMLLIFKRQEQGLAISSIPIKVSKATPGKSPLKRANTVSRMSTLDTTHLHAYYIKLLSKSNDVFSAVSRTEFVDIINMLETVGIVGRVSNGASTPSKTGRRTFGRSTSFSCGTKASASSAIGFVEGVRADEILRGLGVCEQAIAEGKEMDTQQEELRAIWTKELRDIRKDVDALTKSNIVIADGFADMTEDD